MDKTNNSKNKNEQKNHKKSTARIHILDFKNIHVRHNDGAPMMAPDNVVGSCCGSGW
jgi:hypothetical protein